MALSRERGKGRTQNVREFHPAVVRISASRYRRCHVEGPMADPSNRTVIKSAAASRPRKVDKVPFVELYAGRLQGVVSSGSDEDRVYVSYFEAGTTNFYCSTNNNRPCGGLRGSPCKHLDALMGEGLLQFGAGR